MKWINDINENTFIISDTHFDHANMLKYEPIRQQTAEQQHLDFDLYLVEQWNAVVGPDDLVLHLGDFAFHNIDLWSHQLNGRKILLKGNHDKKEDTIYTHNHWEVVSGHGVKLHGAFYFLDLGTFPIDTNTPAGTSHDREDQSEIMMYLPPGYSALIVEIQHTRILFSHIPVFDDNPFDEKFAYTRQILAGLFQDHQCDVNIHGHIHSKLAKSAKCLNVSVEHTQFRPIRIKDLLTKALKP